MCDADQNGDGQLVESKFPPPVQYVVLDLPRTDVGEDAEPLVWQGRTFSVLGVFDGMGGAGARKVELNEGVHSTAWYAARLARQATADVFAQADENWSMGPDELERLLSSRITEALVEADRVAPARSAMVRSTLIRAYPTTVALLVFAAATADVRVLSLWAGDSRCYALSPGLGLQQLSWDHGRTGADPMTALRNDSPLSNLFSAEGTTTMTWREATMAAPMILLVASDGAFASLASPMHFEWHLLEALCSACEQEEWSRVLAERLQPLATDDISLSAALVGFENMTAAAEAFRPRLQTIQGIVARYETDCARAAELAREAEALRVGTIDRLSMAWESYREGYMAHIEANGARR